MKTVIILIMGLFIVKGETMLFDFNTKDNSGEWYIINDGVMGGLSKSEIILNQNGTATFRGKVRLENNGGFASIRSRITNLNEGYKGVKIRVKGDGNIYSLRFRTDQNFDGFAYQSKFKSINNEWTEVKIPFKDFTPTYRGYTLSDKPALESQNIAQIGFLIADYQSGNFEIDIDWISFY